MADAVARGDMDNLKEELGDLLLAGRFSVPHRRRARSL